MNYSLSNLGSDSADNTFSTHEARRAHRFYQVLGD